MAVTQSAVVSSTVVFRPGVNTAIGGGFAFSAGTVTQVDSSGLVVTVNVQPPGGAPQTFTNVRHVSLAAVGEACWDFPQKLPGSGNAVSTILTLSSAAPATWPLAQTGGLVLISQWPAWTIFDGVGLAYHVFIFFGATPPLPISRYVPSGGTSVTGSISYIGGDTPFLLTVSTNANTPTQFLTQFYGWG
jgi:hypothetical protein